jgi:putative flavoprotein involved in K+ transport
MTGVDGRRVMFAPDLPATTGAADRRLRRVLEAIDRHIDESGLTREVLEPEPLAPVSPGPMLERLDLRDAGIATVLWATGFRRAYPWLHVPVLDATGEIRHRRGVTPVPGLHVLGQRFQHARRSSFIDGVGADAEFLADHMTRTTSGTRF